VTSRPKWTKLVSVLIPTLLLTAALGTGGALQSSQDLCSPLTRAFDYIDRFFYQPDRVDLDQAMYGALKGLVEHLEDPYSEFLDPEEYAQFQESLAGRFTGVGIEITIRDDVLIVIAPLAETPAEAAGVRAGDEILAIDGESTEGITITEAALRIRGEEGTTVVLSVRHNDGTEEDIAIVRATIEVEALMTELVGDEQVLRLRIMRFDDEVDLDIGRALADYDLGRLDGIILDLRNNPGGLLDSAISLADYFVDRGTIVTTRSRVSGDEVYSASGQGEAIPNLPLVVLINEGTASAAEIAAAAIRDNDMGILIGRKSFGKGVIQHIYRFPDSSALKITTGEYFTPLGRTVQEVGLTPDIELGEDDDALQTAIDWIVSHAGVRMPIPLGSDGTE